MFPHEIRQLSTPGDEDGAYVAAAELGDAEEDGEQRRVHAAEALGAVDDDVPRLVLPCLLWISHEQSTPLCGLF